MNQYQLYQKAKAELEAARRPPEKRTIDMDEAHKVVAGALYDFCAYLTIHPKDLVIGMFQDAGPLLEQLQKFIAARKVDENEARVLFWQDIIKK